MTNQGAGDRQPEFDLEERTARFGEANAMLSGTALRVGRLQALIFPIVMIILNASTVGVLWFGAGRVQSGAMQVGSLTAFMAYLIQILISVMMATFMAMMIPRASVSADRIGEVHDFSVDSASEQLSRVQLKRGLLFGHEIELPIEWIDGVTVKGISLRVSKDEVQRLASAA